MAVLAVAIAVLAAACGGDSAGEAGSPWIASYSDTDDDTIAFMIAKRSVIDEALVACEAFVEDAGAAFDEDDRVAFEAAEETWREAHDDLDEVARDFGRLSEGDDARVREAMAVWRRYAVEVGGLYRAIGAATDVYLEHGADVPAFDRAWVKLEEQREVAYDSLRTCDEIVYGIWEPR